MQQLILGAIRADCRLRWPGRGWVLSTTEVAKEILTQEVGSAPLIPVDEQQANWTQLGGKGRLISPPFSGSDIWKFVWLTILVRARSSSLTTKDTDYKAWWEKVWWGRVVIGKGDGPYQWCSIFGFKTWNKFQFCWRFLCGRVFIIIRKDPRRKRNFFWQINYF